jgi:hypothetical protein
MSDQATQNRSEGKKPDRPEIPPTPFDNPLFLPVLLFAGMLWFGYDGFLTSDPDMLEHQTFNRGGFAVLALLTLYYGYKGLKEYREDRAQAQDVSGVSRSGSEPPAQH